MKLTRTEIPSVCGRCQIWGLLIICAWLMPGFLQSALAERRPIEWLGRPWELRYVVYVSDYWSISVENAQERKDKAGTKALDRAWWELLIKPRVFFPSRDKWARPGDGLSVVVVEFDQDGKVKSPHAAGAPLYGKIDRILDVTLSEGGDVNKPRYDLGFWFMGLGDVSTHWAPGLCKASEMPNPFANTDLGTGYLYGPRFEPSSSVATFGCREWAYQLQHPNRPYIDITSYVNKKDDPDGSGTYVHELFGWARFSDEPKPVIGKHEKDWYCFHECPGGDKPGLIPDIKAWAKKNGWPAPVRPTRIPVFPDPPAKSGRYPIPTTPISSSGGAPRQVQEGSGRADEQRQDFPDVSAGVGC
jgi:hypothetical protein